MDISHNSLLIRTARLYYESGLNQNAIADELNISRPYVSKLLIEARQEGIVTIRIKDPMNTETRLERKIREAFDLKKVIVVETALCQDAVTAVAKRAAEWLGTILKDGDTLALGWGRTMYLLTQSIRRRTDLNDISVVSLYGMQSIMHENVYNIEGLTQITEALNAGTCYALTMPAIMANASLKEALYREESIAAVLDKLKKANIAAFTIGVPRRSSFLGSLGALSPEELKGLLNKGMISELCLHLLDASGNICDSTIEKRTVTLSLEELRNKEYRIAVASGRHKIDAVYAALKTGCINVLVVDEEIAKELSFRVPAEVEEKKDETAK